jgi:hypothetical protein
MRAPAEISPDELREAHDAADTLVSEKFRGYLPGRMLPMLLSKFRDDARDALGMELPPRLPVRARHQKLEALTDPELEAITGHVAILLDKFASFMDDPALPEALGDFRADLTTERGDRNILRATFGQHAEAS